MQKIIPHLWFDKEAVEAAEFYSATFPASKIISTTALPNTPSGDCDIVTFDIWGHRFMSISAGPLFKINASISFMVNFDPKFFKGSEDEARKALDYAWDKLSDGGTVLMPIDEYFYSKRYGWIQDKYRDTKMGQIHRYGPDQQPDDPNSIAFADFILEKSWFSAMDSARMENTVFNEAISLMVYCKNQEEIDYYWDKLSAVPEAEQCGWVKDQFGVSWQVVPESLDKMMSDKDPERSARVTQAFLRMKKFDLAELENAYRGVHSKV
jgi:predicted 3-demethylubiquinone-9 3-methyltransferase (glyoxalase superfamily)